MVQKDGNKHRTGKANAKGRLMNDLFCQQCGWEGDSYLQVHTDTCPSCSEDKVEWIDNPNITHADRFKPRRYA